MTICFHQIVKDAGEDQGTESFDTSCTAGRRVDRGRGSAEKSGNSEHKVCFYLKTQALVTGGREQSWIESRSTSPGAWTSEKGGAPWNTMPW